MITICIAQIKKYKDWLQQSVKSGLQNAVFQAIYSDKASLRATLWLIGSLELKVSPIATSDRLCTQNDPFWSVLLCYMKTDKSEQSIKIF